MSGVAPRHSVNANQVLSWRKQYQEGSLAAVKAGESVVPASGLAAAIKEVKELQRLLEKKTMEVEITRRCASRSRWTVATGKRLAGRRRPAAIVAMWCAT